MHITAFIACLMTLVCIVVKNPQIVEYAIYGLAFLAVPPAMRHSIGDLAGGGGIKGAVKVLMTDAKVGDAAP